MALDISIQTVTAESNIPPAAFFHRIVRRALEAVDDAEITIRLVDAAESRALNKRWRCMDKPTNVLSFPINSTDNITATAPALMGDLVMCAALIHREAAEQRKGLRAHWAHLTIHGILHISGYDHIDAQGAQRMEAREIHIMRQCGYANPYL